MARKRPKRRQPAYKITVPSSENGEVECYSLDLDQLDLGLLPVENLLERLRSNSNSNVSVLWQTQAALKGNSSIACDGQDCESFTVHAVRDSRTEDDEGNVSSSPSDRLTDLTQSCAQSISVTQRYVQTVHCHICSLYVPEGYTTEHVQSDMHLALLRLANTALGRMNKHTEQLIDRMTREKGTALQMSEYPITAECQNKTTPKACYCVPCNVVVELSLVESHESEPNHKNSVKRQMQLVELCEVYTNDQAPDNKDSPPTDDLAPGKKGANSVEKLATVNVHSPSEDGNIKQSSIENLATGNTDSSALIQSVTLNTYSAVLRKNSSGSISQTVRSLANCMQNKTNSQKDSTNIDEVSTKPLEKPSEDIQKPLNFVFGLIGCENVQKNCDCELNRYEKEGKVTHCESRDNEIEENSSNHVSNKTYVSEDIKRERNEHINKCVLKNTDNTENRQKNVVASEENSEKVKKCNNIVSVDKPTLKKTSKNTVHDKSVLSSQESVVTSCDKPTKDSPSTSYKNADETESSTQKNIVTTANDSPKSDKQMKDAFPLNEINAKKTKSTIAHETKVKPLTDILETSKQLDKKPAKFYNCEICLTTVPNTGTHIADHCNGKKHKKMVAKCHKKQSNECNGPIQSSVETNNAIQLLGENNNSVQQSIEPKRAAEQSGGTNSANQQSNVTNIAIQQSKGRASSIQQCHEINDTLRQTDETESAVQQESKENLVQLENNTAECDSKKKDVFSHDNEKHGLNGSFEQLDEAKTSNPKHEFEGPAQLTNAETDVQKQTDSDENADCTKQFFCTICEVYLPNNATTISQHMEGKIHQNKLKSMSNLITNTKSAGNEEEAGKSTGSSPDVNRPSSQDKTRRGKTKNRSENYLKTCVICPGNKKNTAEHEDSLEHQRTINTLSGYLKYINYVGLSEEVLQKKNILLKTNSGAELPITTANWHGLMGDEASMTYYCTLCEETVGYTGFQYHEHIQTLSHVRFVSHKPKQGIREIVIGNEVKYHCVVCNIICYDFILHVEALQHRHFYIQTANGRCEPNEMKCIITEDPLPRTTEESCAIS